MNDDHLQPATIRRLERRAALLQSRGRIPSLVTGVVRDSALVWSSAHGTFPAGVEGLEQQYRIGSITKTFIAVAVLRLRDAGALRLSDAIETHLPGTPFGDRTVSQLLSHTGGIAAEPPGSWWERSPGRDATQLRDDLERGSIVDHPGRQFHYSNVGFAVLGDLIARAGGRNWSEIVTDDILNPLGMNRTTARPVAPYATGYAVHPYADLLLPEAIQDTLAMGPAGQLWSTVADLGRWASFLAGDTAEVLSKDSLAEMSEPQAISDGPEWTHGMGLGLMVWRSKGRRLVGHGGSMPGFQANVTVDPEAATGAVLMINCTTPGEVDRLEDPLDILDECEPRMPAPWVASVALPTELLELTGSWFWGTSESRLRVLTDGQLQLDRISGMVSTSRFRPNGDGTWTGCDEYYRNEVLRVVRASDGSLQHLDIATFIFTRRPYEPAAAIPGGLEDGGWPTTTP